MPTAGPPLTARLSITIAQAKLSKNYGKIICEISLFPISVKLDIIKTRIFMHRVQVYTVVDFYIPTIYVYC